MNKQGMVEEFMRATGRQRVPSSPEIPDLASRILRARLVLEEALEFARSQGLTIANWSHDINMESLRIYESATQQPSMDDVADGLADLLYVVYGAAVAWGIKIDPVFGEVHRSNMTKFIDGHEREDGKWIKGPSYEPPRIEEVLAAQGWHENVCGL